MVAPEVDEFEAAAAAARAGVLFTASSSVREHHRLGGVDWSIVRRLGPAAAPRWT